MPCMASSGIQYPHIMITRSSAGSGKTYNLALRYLQTLLDRDCRISSILAITFTNKASQEMRDRIMEWMKRFLLGLPVSSTRPGALLADVLGRALELFPSAGTEPVALMPFREDSPSRNLSRMEKNFIHLLRQYSDFKVSTIDSFNTFIIRAVSFKLGLDPDFEILLEPGAYIASGLKELFQDIIDDLSVRALFDDFIKSYFRIRPEKLKWDAGPLLKKLITFIWSREMEKGLSLSEPAGAVSLPDLAERMARGLRQVRDSLGSEQKILLNGTFSKALDNALSAAAFQPDKMRKWLHKNFDFSGGSSGLLRKGSCLPDEATAGLWEELRGLFSEYYLERSVQSVSAVIRVYRKFVEKLEALLRRNRIVLISELNTLLKRLLSSEEVEIPEIYYYLSERFCHFLIDEFQDTSTLQWQNLEFLIREEFSRGGSLFLVGDEKQSIFRWRGGNSELVSMVKENFDKKIYPVAHFYRLGLEENFRSGGEIVLFNNGVFHFDNLRRWMVSLLPGPEEAGLIESHLSPYRNSAQRFAADKKGKGCVRVERLVIENDNEKERDEAVKERLLSGIEEMMRDFNWRQKDIAVLTRKKKEANKVVSWLLEKGYQVESELTVSVRSHPLVLEIIRFLSFLNDVSDNLAFIDFITGRIFSSLSGMSREETFGWLQSVLIREKECRVYVRFREARPALWEDAIEFFFNRAGYLPLYEFLLLLYKKWDLFARFPDSAPYFLRFAEIVQGLGAESRLSLPALLHFWDEALAGDKTFLLKMLEGVDAVKVMTIHSSKGLQFPVVFVPFAGSEVESNNFFVTQAGEGRMLLQNIDMIAADFSPVCRAVYYAEQVRSLVDEINDLYVAFTRAEHVLFVHFNPAGKEDGNKLAGLLFQENGQRVIEKGRHPARTGVTEDGDEESLFRVDPVDACRGADGMEWLDLIRLKVKKSSGISRRKHEAGRLGETVHFILSLIEEYREEELDENVRTGARRYGLASAADEIKNNLKRAFSNPDFARFFDFSAGQGRLFIEKSIVAADGKESRADRFIVYPDRIELVDFKTGEEYRDLHREQILGYKNLLAGIFPGRQVDCYLAYLDKNEVMKV